MASLLGGHWCLVAIEMIETISGEIYIRRFGDFHGSRVGFRRLYVMLRICDAVKDAARLNGFEHNTSVVAVFAFCRTFSIQGLAERLYLVTTVRHPPADKVL